MRRGEVWWADLAPRSGSEQRGRRPVVIVSHDAFNAVAGWRSVIVVPLTTKGRKRRTGPTSVGFPVGTAGLPAASAALCHQVTTLDRAKLVEHIGALPAEQLARLERGLMAALDLRPAA
jgi:mRNA interferase MazF